MCISIHSKVHVLGKHILPTSLHPKCTNKPIRPNPLTSSHPTWIQNKLDPASPAPTASTQHFIWLLSLSSKEYNVNVPLLWLAVILIWCVIALCDKLFFQIYSCLTRTKYCFYYVFFTDICLKEKAWWFLLIWMPANS